MKAKTAITFISIFAICISGCGVSQGVSQKESSSADEPISSNSVSSVSESSLESSSNSSLFTVDWERCISDTKDSITGDSFNYVKDVSIEVKEDKKQIVFSAVLDDATDPQLALDYADTMIRQFNLFASTQDDSISLGNKDFYGGLYNEYQIMLGIAPLSKIENQSEWFVFDVIGAKAHTSHEIKLEKSYR